MRTDRDREDVEVMVPSGKSLGPKSRGLEVESSDGGRWRKKFWTVRDLLPLADSERVSR